MPVRFKLTKWRNKARARREKHRAGWRVGRSLIGYNPHKFFIKCPVPASNITVNSATYASVATQGGSSSATLIKALYGAGAPGTDACFAMYFTLADIPQATTYTNLFDQYKIEHVKVILIPQGETGDGVYSNTTQANQQTSKSLWYVVDYDDATASSNTLAISQYQGAKLRMVDCFSQAQPFKISMKPHVALAAYQSSAFSAYANKGNVWLDTQYPNTQHYGLKLGFQSLYSTSEAVTQFQVFAEYSLAFKNVK